MEVWVSLKNRFYPFQGSFISTARRIKTLLLTTAIISAWPVFCARAEVASGNTVFSLEQLLSMMSESNPQLAQARFNQIAAKTAIPQARAWEGPEIQLTEGGMPGHPFNINESEEFSYGLTQSILFPGKRKLEVDIAKAEAGISGHETEGLFLELSAQLKSNFYQLLFLQKQYQINQDNIKRLETMQKIAKVQYANNAAAYVDYLNAQVEQSSAENEQFTLEREIETVRQTINTLIGREPAVPLAVKGELPGQKIPKQPVRELENMALANNPESKSSVLEVNAAKKGLSLARMSFLPDFGLTLSNNSDNPPYGMSGNEYELEFALTLPSWFLIREKAGLDQAKAMLSASQAGDAYNRLQIRLAVDTAFNELQVSLKQIDFIRTRQLAQAKIAYQLGLKNYSNANMDFSDLLTAQTSLHESELSLLESEFNAAQAYIDLVTVIGKELD